LFFLLPINLKNEVKYKLKRNEEIMIDVFLISFLNVLEKGFGVKICSRHEYFILLLTILHSHGQMTATGILGLCLKRVLVNAFVMISK